MASTQVPWNGTSQHGAWYKLGNPAPVLHGPPPEYKDAEDVGTRKSSEPVNGLEEKADYYYYPDSDLETIVEESSVIDSEDEFGYRPSIDGLKSASNFSNTNGRISGHTSKGSESSHSSLSSSSTPRQQGDHRDGIEEVSPVKTLASQKIIYAKCLTPRAQPSQHSQRLPEPPYMDNGEYPEQPGTISDMFEAVRRGDLHSLSTFSVGEINDTVDERGNTALHVAAEHGQTQCVRRLVSTSNPQLITLPNDDLMTPTAMAIKNGHVDCVQWLVLNTAAREELAISRRPSSFDGSSTRPPIAHVAARYDRDDILDWLCEEMAAEGYPVDTADHCSNTPVHVAARYGHLSCIQTLVSRGASVTMLNSDGDTPGQAAQKFGHGTCVGYLVVVETCVSLAQQLVALRTDMEVLRSENEQLRKSSKVSTPNSSDSSFVFPPPPEHLLHSPKQENHANQAATSAAPVITNGFPETGLTNSTASHRTDTLPEPRTNISRPLSARNKPRDGAGELPISPQRQKLQEQPPPPKLWRNDQPDPQIPSPKRSWSRPTSGKQPRSPKVNGEVEAKGDSFSMQQKINAALNGPGTSLDETAVDGLKASSQEQPKLTDAKVNQSQGNVTSPARRKDVNHVNTSLAPVEQVVHTPQTNANPANVSRHNDEVAMLTKDIESPQKKPWEKLSMDEMLRMVRDIRYQPSPSISLCTEDSTMESADVMRERMAAASRWFLVERTRGKAPTYSQGIKSNGKANNHEISKNSPQSKRPSRAPHNERGNPALSWVPPPAQHSDVTARNDPAKVKTASLRSEAPANDLSRAIDRAYNTLPSRPSQQQKHQGVGPVASDFPTTRPSGTLKFMVTNGKSHQRVRNPGSPDSGRSAKTNSPKSSAMSTPQDTPPITPTKSSAQRNSSYRRAVNKPNTGAEAAAPVIPVETRSSSESLSSGSTNSRRTVRSQASDQRSTHSGKSNNFKSKVVPDPLKKRSNQQQFQSQTEGYGKSVPSTQQHRSKRSDLAQQPPQERFTAIDKPIAAAHNYHSTVKPVTVNKGYNPRAPYSWSVPRGYSTGQSSHYRRYNAADEGFDDDDVIQPASEVPEMRAQIPSRQSSFLRKVQGKFK